MPFWVFSSSFFSISLWQICNISSPQYSRFEGRADCRPSQLRDAAQVFAIKHPPNTEHILPGCLYRVFVAAPAPSPPALNKYILLGCCQHSSFKSDECISAVGFIITSVKMAAVLTITYKNRHARQVGCLLATHPFFFLFKWVNYAQLRQGQCCQSRLSGHSPVIKELV